MAAGSAKSRERLSEDPEQHRPQEGRKRPLPGESVYVPDRDGQNMLVGGLAVVSEKSTRQKLFVNEDPHQEYSWWRLCPVQYDLWKKFGISRARLATLDEVRAKDEEREARRVEESRRKEAAKLAPVRLPVLNRGLLNVPIWGDTRRSKNWACLVELDPTIPGGFARRWFERGNGPSFYIVPEVLRKGDTVEFGADRVYAGNGRRTPDRWYGVVVDITATHMDLRKYDGPAEALQASAGVRSMETEEEKANG